MKTIQAVARYFPEQCGGIQIRLSETTPLLKRQGIESKIIAPHAAPEAKSYRHKGIEVYRYPAFPTVKPEPNHGEFIHGGFEQFGQWLRSQEADIYHQHQWTADCGLPHLRLAKSLGLSTIVSIRLPQAICQRHTLMEQGKTACDGKIDVLRCSRCCDPITDSFPDAIVEKISQIPLKVFETLPLPNSVYGLPTTEKTKGKWLRPFATPAFVAARQRSLLEMAKYSDRIITLSEQIREMLLMNGVPPEKVLICRTGIPDSFPVAAPKATVPKPLRVVFLGRWAKTKGIHILVEAIQALPADVPLELTIFGITIDKQYRQDIEQKVKDDPRIQIKPALSRDEIPTILPQFDVLALPAQWFDVRPMVILEAHRLGLPVLGSQMGGILEMVRDGVDGLLLPPTDVSAWSEALFELATDGGNLLNQLRCGIPPVRTMEEEVAQTIAIYEELLSQRSSSESSLEYSL